MLLNQALPKMSKYLFLATFCSLFIYLSAQEHHEIKSSWFLDKVELSGFVSPDLSFSKEECFFANYLDQSQALDLSSTKLSIILGGDDLSYTYQIEGSKIIFNYLNTVYIQSANTVQTKETLGSTDFQYSLEGNKLILHRKNETFIERYTFILAN